MTRNWKDLPPWAIAASSGLLGFCAAMLIVVVASFMLRPKSPPQLTKTPPAANPPPVSSEDAAEVERMAEEIYQRNKLEQAKENHHSVFNAFTVDITSEEKILQLLGDGYTHSTFAGPDGERHLYVWRTPTHTLTITTAYSKAFLERVVVHKTWIEH